MKRREFLTLLGAAMAGSRGASAQTSSKNFHLGTLTPGLPIGEKSPGGATLLRVLGERGYRFGENLTYDGRGAMRKISLLPQMLQEMKANRVDAVVILAIRRRLPPSPPALRRSSPMARAIRSQQGS